MPDQLSREAACWQRWLSSAGSRSPRGAVAGAEKALREGNAAEALALARRALRSAPTDREAVAVEALALASLGAAPSAAAALRRALRRDPDAALLWGLLGLVMHRMGRDRASMSCLARSRRLRPRSGWPAALEAMMLGDRRQGEQLWRSRRAEAIGSELPYDVERRLGLLDAALRREEAPWVYRLRAECLEKAGRVPEAIADLDRALALSSRDPELYGYRAHCLLYQKRYARAAQDLARAIRLAPESAALRKRKAHVLWLAGRRRAARAETAAWLRAAPRDPEALVMASRLSMPGSRARLRRLARGQPPLEAAQALLEGGRLLRAGRFERAVVPFTRAEVLGRAGAYPGIFCDAGYSEAARGLAFLARLEG